MVVAFLPVDRCEDCGFVYASVEPKRAPEQLRDLATHLADRLSEASGDAVRTRPAPDAWSPLEYGCHVRDVLRVQRGRLAHALVEDTPTFTPMGRDERAIRDRYNEQDPAAVTAALVGAADALAAAFEDLDGAGWARTGIYSYPEPAERSMVWLAQHTVHECHHHLMDVERGLR